MSFGTLLTTPPIGREAARRKTRQPRQNQIRIGIMFAAWVDSDGLARKYLFGGSLSTTSPQPKGLVRQWRLYCDSGRRIRCCFGARLETRLHSPRRGEAIM